MGKLKSVGELFEGRHFDREVIILCVRWYLRFKLSLRDLVEMMAERGLSMAHTTIMRWVQRYAPELEQRWRRFARAVGLSWRVDETYVKIRGEWCDRYRAVDRAGRTVDFRLSAKRDVAAAKGVLPQSAQRPAARPADNHIGRLRRISPCGARAESQWLAACQHEAALVEVPEQPD
jgi:transposase-like protein